MIKSIHAVNFKAFEDQEFKIKPITVILGPNNSGKSSFLSLLRILAQTIKSYDTNVQFLLNGPLGDFGTYKDIVFGNSKSKLIEVELVLSAGQRIKNKHKISAPDYKIKLKVGFRSAIKEIVTREISVQADKKTIFCSKYSDESERHLINKVNSHEIPPSLRSVISQGYRLFHFLPHSMFFSGERKSQESSLMEFLKEDDIETLSDLSGFFEPLFRFLEGVEYVGSMRLPPSRSYMLSGERHEKVGVNGQNAASILAMDSLRKGKKSKKIKEKVAEWLRGSMLAKDLKIEYESDRNYEIRIQNYSSGESQNFVDVGYGVSQVVPILVAGYNLDQRDTLIVEEPEIHLHPQAQAELGKFFLDLYADKINSIVETHSEYLVVRLQQYVAQGLISRDDIVFYFIRSGSDGKEVVELCLDEKGVFTSEWPGGFFPQRLEEAKKLAAIRAGMGDKK